MKPSRALTAAALALGVACALLLLWLWRREVEIAPLANRSPAPAVAAVPVDAVAAAAAARTRDSTALSPLLAGYLQALARGNARAREAVLTFKDDAALQRFLARAGQSGLSVVGTVDALRAVRVRFDSMNALQREVGDNASDYADVGANNLIRIPTAPTREQRAAVDQVPFGNDTLAFIGATGDRSGWGRGTTIAVLDTGVAADPTFGLGRVRTLDIGWGTTPSHENVNADGHGTAVAALAAGANRDAGGVAPAAEILSIRVTDTNGTSDLFTISQAIVAAVEAGAKIVNVSLGGYTTGPALDAAITYATQQGAVIVAAAGNDQASQLAWPAADPRVISVGAVDKAEQQVSFSNSGAQLQLTAPGYGVQTAWLDGQRVYVDGTSASAPLVAGAIAAVMSANPSLTAREATDLLLRTANDTGAPGADPAFGRGTLNLSTALNSGNPAYVDTAIASHYYDAANNQMQFTVQNRSGRMVTGLSLQATFGATTLNWGVPPLAPGETYVATAPADEIALKAAGSIRYQTTLTNPAGVVDQVPANNQRTTVLSAPKP